MRRLAALALAFWLTAAAAPPDAEAWYEILGPDGQLIGFQVERSSPTPEGLEVSRERQMRYRVEGHGITQMRSQLIRVYGPEGRLIRFRSEQQVGDSVVTIDGAVAAGNLVLSRVVGGRRVQRAVPWAAEADLLDPLSVTQGRVDGFELAPDGLRIDRHVLRQVKQEDGQTLRLSYVDGRLTRVVLADANGERLELPQLGYSLAVRRSDAPLSARHLANVKRLPHERWASPFFIPAAALRGQIRYQFGFRHGFSADLPQTGEQRVQQTDQGWQVDICETCGPDLASDAQSLARWREPNAWIQSDAPEIRAAARPAMHPGLSDTARMERLARIARDRMAQPDFEGYYPARAAWKRRAGDCTEDALVLASLARAAGIPARIASGVTYSRTRYHGAANAFMPHAWVIAWVDGRWKSYDISLEGFDATHIALSLSDGEPGGYIEAMQLSALLDWQGMREVRKRD